MAWQDWKNLLSTQCPILKTYWRHGEEDRGHVWQITRHHRQRAMRVLWLQLITSTMIIMLSILVTTGIQRGWGKHLTGCYLWDSRPELACELTEDGIPLWQNQTGNKMISYAHIFILFGVVVNIKIQAGQSSLSSSLPSLPATKIASHFFFFVLVCFSVSNLQYDAQPTATK